MTLNTYAALDAFLGRLEHKNIPSIRSTMVIRRRNGDIAVQYHLTDVVTAHVDGTFTLYSAGYRTSTTKSRMNTFSPARVYQTKGVWKLDVGVGQPHREASKDFLFIDGITVDRNGDVVIPATIEYAEAL